MQTLNKLNLCDITRTNCSVIYGVKPDSPEVSASQQSQMDSLGRLSTLNEHIAGMASNEEQKGLEQSTLQYKWCPKDNSKYSLQSCTASKHQKLLFPAITEMLIASSYLYLQSKSYSPCMLTFTQCLFQRDFT